MHSSPPSLPRYPPCSLSSYVRVCGGISNDAAGRNRTYSSTPPSKASNLARLHRFSLLLLAVVAVIVAFLASPLTQRLRLTGLISLSLTRPTAQQLHRTLPLPSTRTTTSSSPRPLFTMPRPGRGGDPYNYLLERMLPFHANFRRTIAMIQQTLPQTQTLPKRDLERFLAVGVQLVHHLEMHHSIEEAHIFPVLASKMPAFGPSATHVHEHEVMHSALETFHSELIATHKRLTSSLGKKAESEGCGQDGKEWPKAVYDGEKVKGLTEVLADALLPHLEAEERSISAKSMREAGWTEEEVLRIPI